MIKGLDYLAIGANICFFITNLNTLEHHVSDGLRIALLAGTLDRGGSEAVVLLGKVPCGVGL